MSSAPARDGWTAGLRRLRKLKLLYHQGRSGRGELLELQVGAVRATPQTVNR